MLKAGVVPTSQPPVCPLKIAISTFMSGIGNGPSALSACEYRWKSLEELGYYLQRVNIPTGQRPTSQIDPSTLKYFDGGPTDPSEWLENFRQSYQRPRRMKDVLVGLLLRTVCEAGRFQYCGRAVAGFRHARVQSSVWQPMNNRDVDNSKPLQMTPLINNGLYRLFAAPKRVSSSSMVNYNV